MGGCGQQQQVGVWGRPQGFWQLCRQRRPSTQTASPRTVALLLLAQHQGAVGAPVAAGRDAGVDAAAGGVLDLRWRTREG